MYKVSNVQLNDYYKVSNVKLNLGYQTWRLRLWPIPCII